MPTRQIEHPTSGDRAPSAQHHHDLVDIHSGDIFVQPTPFGLVYPVTCADGTAPTSQCGRTWEYLTAAGRELRVAGGEN